MADTLTESEGELVQIRNETNRRAWFATRLRERCGAAGDAAPAPRLLRAEEEEDDAPLVILQIEAYLVAQRFHQLPEPGRSALALFYLDSFNNEEIAKLLKLHEDDLAETLDAARTQLKALLRASRSAS